MQAHGTLEFSGGGGIPGPGTIPLTALAPQAAGTVVANNTGGAASPTAVPYASMPWVLKAGDAMTGALSITPASGVGLTVAANGGTTVATSSAVLRSDDPGASGPTLAMYHNSASPAFADVVGRHRYFGKNSAAADTTYGQVSATIIDPTAAAESGQLLFGSIAAGAFANRVALGAGLFDIGSSGQDKGVGSLNFITLWENGVALTSKYAQLTAANTFTVGGQVISAGAANQIAKFTQTASVSPTAIADVSFLLESVNSGINGPTFGLFHNKAAAAVNDATRQQFWFNNSLGVAIRGCQVLASVVSPTSGAETIECRVATFFSGGFNTRFQVGGGIYTTTATGGDQGIGTSNATAYYANANLVADTNGLLRTRSYTVGTLPAAAGVAGALARVSDALAAPVYNAAATGGGTVFANVCSNGTTWLYC